MFSLVEVLVVLSGTSGACHRFCFQRIYKLDIAGPDRSCVTKRLVHSARGAPTTVQGLSANCWGGLHIELGNKYWFAALATKKPVL